jgi:hypothetical protein
MITAETIFQGIFTGFCSYLGVRSAKNTHTKIKKMNIKKYLRRWIK